VSAAPTKSGVGSLVGRVVELWRNVLSTVKRRDRSELSVLLAALLLLALAQAFLFLAGQVLEGDTQSFDERMLAALRDPSDPSVPIGPWWLRTGALDITALGSPTVLGLAVLAVSGYLVLQQLYRIAGFVVFASLGGWLLNDILKNIFERTRPDIVPHLREVASPSFPSGHALTSAAVFLTLGVLLMRVSESKLTKFYCLAVAMFATLLVGLSRIFLGVHYPTDVLAGWLIGLSWALLCWIVERVLERRRGWKRERQEAAAG
jgi:undecaprenyl-diphosphatase